MDEQRMQAYVGLIGQLLGCAQGEEGALLQANAGLVDAGLLAVMGQYADWLESQGNGNAQWLRGLASQLATAIGLKTTASQGAEAARQFLLETLQLIVDKQGDPQQIYLLWAPQQARFNADLLAVLPTVAAQLLQGDTERRTFIAAVLVDFGNLIKQFPLGTRWLNLELSIAAYEQALQVRTRQHLPVEWAQTMNNLAAAYSNRIRGDRAENIEDAIAAYEQSLQVRTRETMPVDWATSMMNLANVYQKRIRGDQAQNIEEAINAYEQSLQVMTRETMPVEWARTLMNLAAAYKNRIRGDRSQNIEDAIAAYEQSLQVMTREAMPVDWATAMMNLALAYSDRIWGDRAQNVEDAIAIYEQSLQVITRETMPVEWATVMMNLASAYHKRFRGDRAQNIEDAIAAYEQSLQVMTRETTPVEWATAMMNLALAYKNRIRGDRSQNIEDAINAYEQSLQVRTRETMPVEWAQMMNNLASAYYSRIQGDQAQNIEDAIAAYEQSLQVITRDAMPVEWAQTMTNLALAYKNRIRGDRAQNIEAAINAYQDSLEIFTPELLPDYCRTSARSLANLLSEQQRWQEAEPMYQMALDAAETLYQSANLLDSKSAELAATANLPRRAAYAIARTGRLQKAVEILEQGRARGLSESLDRDRTNLKNLEDKNLENQYKEITQQLRNLEALQRDRMVSSDRNNLTPEVLRNEATHLRQELTTTIDQIRQQLGYETFLTFPTFEDVQKAVTPDSFLIYLLTTPTGSLALIVTPITTDHLWFDSFTETQLTDFLKAWFAAYNNVQNDRQAWYDIIEENTKHLWEPIMGPLIQKLQELSCDRITLIPTGYLSLLPLHAAWTEDKSKPTKRRYAFDDIHITYAPNAKSLTAAQEIVKTIAVGEASLLENRVQANSILAIDNPRQDLPNSEREINAAISTFSQPNVLRHKSATIAAVKEGLVGAAIAHFSCHGTANLNDPLNSGLLMHDGLLTLKDIFALNLADSGGLRLAILSACETGMIGTENADEAISLPTGLLQAGVAAVIASLWAVPEFSTMLLLVKFYDNWRNQNQDTSEALRQAQQWLRDTTNQEKSRYFAQQAGQTIPQEVAEYLAVRIGPDLEIPDERSFAIPITGRPLAIQACEHPTSPTARFARIPVACPGWHYGGTPSFPTRRLFPHLDRSGGN